MSTNDQKMMLKFVVLSIALARQGTILQVAREISSEQYCRYILDCVKLINGLFDGI
jgi:hypothetical protein